MDGYSISQVAERTGFPATKVAELQAFTAELRRVAVTLSTDTPDGPCDETCGCTTDHNQSDRHRPVALGPRLEPRDTASIACTLSPDRALDQLAGWQAIVANATGCEAIDRGTRLRFDRQIDVAALAALVAAEQDCCRFLTFKLTVAADNISLDVTGTADAQPFIDALIGSAR